MYLGKSSCIRLKQKKKLVLSVKNMKSFNGNKRDCENLPSYI